MSEIIQLPSSVVGRGASVLDTHNPAIRTDTVYAISTSIEDTFAAVRVAGDFAQTLGVPVTLIHFRTVPYALPVDEPGGISSVETDEFVARLRAEGLDVSVHVYLCRDKRQAIPVAFRPHSLIVVAGRRTWLRTESDWWRQTLEAAGHFVVFVDKAQHQEKSHA